MAGKKKVGKKTTKKAVARKAETEVSPGEIFARAMQEAERALERMEMEAGKQLEKTERQVQKLRERLAGALERAATAKTVRGKRSAGEKVSALRAEIRVARVEQAQHKEQLKKIREEQRRLSVAGKAVEKHDKERQKKAARARGRRRRV